jgi:hypothetical protein
MTALLDFCNQKKLTWTRALLRPCFFALFISGCNTVPVSQGSDVQLPAWYDDPSLPGYIGVTSSAPPQSMGGLEGQRRAALLIARAEMARMKSVQVQSLSQSSTTTTSSGVTFSNEDFRRAGSTQLLQLNNVVVRDEWIHPQTGEMFLWLVYPVSR